MSLFSNVNKPLIKIVWVQYKQTKECTFNLTDKIGKMFCLTKASPIK